MNILLLAPEPFYQDRGTPIAIDRMLQILSERKDQVDVVTYHEGWEVKHDYMTLYRIPNLPFVHHIRPGLSWKKLVCDAFVLFKAIRLASQKTLPTRPCGRGVSVHRPGAEMALQNPLRLRHGLVAGSANSREISPPEPFREAVQFF